MTRWHAVAAGAASAGPMAHDATEAPAQTRINDPAAGLDTGREIARIVALQRELALTSERLQYRRKELRWTVTIIVLAGVVVALLTWMLILNMRHRRDLLRLAEQDSLTGLPNRRRTGIARDDPQSLSRLSK